MARTVCLLWSARISSTLSTDVSYILVFRAQVFEGHPFIVEAAVSLGGKTAKPVCICAVAHSGLTTTAAQPVNHPLAGHRGSSFCKPHSALV